VLLTNVVWTDEPESWITVFDVNPVPVTTIVTADEPTGTSLGETDVIARGVATGVVLPPAVVDPEVAGDEPHPESRVAKTQKDTTRRMTPRGATEQIFIESEDYRTPGSRTSENCAM
jgi:hypothetical protein